MKKLFTAFLIAVVSLTLVACDTPETFNIVFDSGIEGFSIAKQEVEKGRVAYEPSEILNKEGYIFVYWTLNDIEYDFSDPVYNDLNIVAKWVEESTIIEYTVSFDSNGGSSVSSMTVEKGNKVSKPKDPTRQGYKFDYWSLDNVQFNFESEINESIKLFANWSKENQVVKHTVTFDSNGGSKVPSINVNEGTKLGKPNDPIKLEYTFSYWSLEGVQFNFNTLITRPITLVANWNKDIPVVKHTVTFDTDGGSKINSVDVVEGMKLDRPSIPYKSGFIFVSWQLDGVDYDFESKVIEPFTLKATYRVREAGVLHPYYENRGLENATGDEFRSILKTRIEEGVNIMGYNKGLNPYLIDADKHPTQAGQVYTIYDGEAMSSGASGSSGAFVWNKEHVMPQSWYVPNHGNKGDLHNLRIARASINTIRSSYSFAGGSGQWSKVTGGFYPGDDHRGDSARIAMYMMVRFPKTLTMSKVFAGKDTVNMMLKWHFEDPVDAFEERRNEVLYGVQKNRNPFIDHPEFTEVIWGAYNANLTTMARFRAMADTTGLLIDLIPVIEVVIPNNESKYF